MEAQSHIQKPLKHSGETASNFKTVSLNVRGFGNLGKQKEILLHLQRYKATFICLSDTRFDSRKENIFRNIYGTHYQIFCSNYASNSRGTLILIPREIPVNVTNYVSSPDGNKVTISANYYGKTMSITAVYGPNTDCPVFF